MLRASEFLPFNEYGQVTSNGPNPKIFDLADLPVRPERHVKTSITTIRITIAQVLARKGVVA